MGLLKEIFKSNKLSIEEISERIKQSYIEILEDNPDTGKEAALKRTLNSLFPSWTDKELQMLMQSVYSKDELINRIKQIVDGQLVGWD